MPFQPRYGDLEQRIEHLEREWVRNGQSGQNPNQQAQGAWGSGAVVVQATGTLEDTIPESQVIFDDTGGHDHSAGNSTAVPLSGDVTGTNQAAVVVRIEGVPLSGAPAGGDDHKFIRYDSGLNQFVYSGAVMLAPDSATRNTITPASDSSAGLIIQQPSTTYGSSLLLVKDFGGGTLLQVVQNGGLFVAANATGGNQPLILAASPGAASPTFAPLEVRTRLSSGGAIQARFKVFGDNHLAWDDFTTTTLRTAANLIPSWRDATDATRAAQFSFQLRGTGSGTIEALNLSVTGASTPMAGFLGATPVVRPAATTDLRQALIDLGLYTTGGATPLNLNGGVFTTTGSGNALGSSTFTGDLTLSTHDLVTDTVTGTRFGTGATQKLGFFGATPVVRAAAYTLAGSATRVFPADPSSGYSGIDNLQVGAVYAQVADVNTLRGVVSTLLGVVRQLATDLGSSAGVGLVNA